MQWFRDLRTMKKILFLVIMMLALMSVIACTGYYTSTTIASNMDRLYNEFARPAIIMGEAKALAIQNRRMLLSVLNTKDMDVAKIYEDRMAANRNRVTEIYAEFDKLDMPPEIKAIKDKLPAVRANCVAKQNEAMEVWRNGEVSQELRDRMSTGGDIARWEDEYVALYDDLVSKLERLCADTNRLSAEEAVEGERTILVALVLALTSGTILGYVISRMITDPIHRIQDSVRLFAKGDLSSRFPTAGKDELGEMGRGLQHMAEDLSRIIVSVKEASRNVTEKAEDFSALAEETNASVEEFRTNVDDMSSSLRVLSSSGDEVNASVEEVAVGAQATAEKGTDIARRVDDAMRAGDHGMSAVSRATSGIEGVADNATTTAKSVQELGQRTRQIQNFVAQIGGIADQTNLLALNAAIEAARAGEAGRGFAVVAEEVRKLAEDSNVAAKNIADLANTITGELEAVVKISLENAKESENAKNLSRETEGIIGNMISYLKEISGATQDLAAVSEEQAASSEEIAEAVQNISEKVQSSSNAGENIRTGIGEVAAAAERVASGAVGLSCLAGDMQEMLAFFKMEGDAPSARPVNSSELAISRQVASVPKRPTDLAFSER
ncbi:MAG: methyl-accepting chemotaxis protein [Synergistaceae bacterium]|jgi:methyl-accepting chemotaxis protein|nr:methyl-accepting chemotaxis protein [Synergistaceae bacterium]